MNISTSLYLWLYVYLKLCQRLNVTSKKWGYHVGHVKYSTKSTAGYDTMTETQQTWNAQGLGIKCLVLKKAYSNWSTSKVLNFITKLKLF